MNNPGKIILVTIVSALLSTRSFGWEDVKIGPQEAVIKTSIRYTVIGMYRAEFGEYSGDISVDEAAKEIRSVSLRIDSASIKSNCAWCDKIVKSKQLLSVKEFPDIIFQSEEITKEGDHFLVQGTLNLHGVTRPIAFPFYVEGLAAAASGEVQLNAKGEWLVHRKEFDIIWNKLLDHGGVLVGDHITVDWEINVNPAY